MLIGDGAVDGMSAYDIYRAHHPGYMGSELDWLEQLIEGTLPFAPASLMPYTFDVNVENNAIITSYTGLDTEMHIPNHIAGYDVIAIDDFAFNGVEFVEHIVIPSSITSIGTGAFADMIALKSLHIPSSVETVGENIVSGSAEVEIFSEHTSQPLGWHPEWNHVDYPVAWFLELDYHGLYADLFSAQLFTFHQTGIEEGIQYDSTLQVYGNAYFFDFLPPSYLSPTERVTWYCVRTPPTFETPPFFDRYDYDVDNACYIEKGFVDSGTYASYSEYAMQVRETFYVPTLESEWFARTITGFALKEAYLDEIPDFYIPGDVYAFEIHLIDEGFGLYIHALFPGNEEAMEGWYFYTDIDVISELPDFVPCAP